MCIRDSFRAVAYCTWSVQVILPMWRWWLPTPPLSLSWTRPCQGCLSTLGRCWCRSRSETIRRHDVQTLALNLHAFQTSRPYLCLHHFDLRTEVMDANTHVMFLDKTFSISMTMHSQHPSLKPCTRHMQWWFQIPVSAPFSFVSYVSAGIHLQSMYIQNYYSQPTNLSDIWKPGDPVHQLKIYSAQKCWTKQYYCFNTCDKISLCAKFQVHCIPCLPDRNNSEQTCNVHCSKLRTLVSPQSCENLTCLVKLRQKILYSTE